MQAVMHLRLGLVGRGWPGMCRRMRVMALGFLGRDSGKYTFSVACYMLELYQDDLADLLLPVQQLKVRLPSPAHLQ